MMWLRLLRVILVVAVVGAVAVVGTAANTDDETTTAAFLMDNTDAQEGKAATGSCAVENVDGTCAVSMAGDIDDNDGGTNKNDNDLDDDDDDYVMTGDSTDDGNPNQMVIAQDNLMDRQPQQDDDEDDEGLPCVDNHDSCDLWSSIGECETNPNYMLLYCRKSCMVCGFDIDDVDLGVEQIIDSKRQTEVLNRIDQAREYVYTNIVQDVRHRHLLEGCKLHHENCAYWGVLGECEANPNYMKKQCAPICNSCQDLSIEHRCPVDEALLQTNAWKAGDLNQFFTNVTTLEEYKQYEPRVLSRPAHLPGDDTPENADYKIGPWVVVLEHVVSEEEANRLVELGGIEGYERSSDVGRLKFDGSYESNVNDGRTSENAWCQHDCYNDTVAQQVIQRLTNITNIPEVNSENLQMLKYEVGQYYKTHHDYIPHLKNRQAGVRLMTVFLYLNTVEEGGGTDFPDLGITVQPKRGRALIWPSVLDEDPDEKDPRTMHQALPVSKGVKYGANAWIHQRDFKTPNQNGCG